MRQHHAKMLAILMMLLMKLTNLPNWVLPSLGLLVFVLCLLTMFFLLVQGVQAIRHRKAKAATLSDSVTDFATHELGYLPLNTSALLLTFLVVPELKTHPHLFPLFTLRRAPRDAQRKTRGRVHSLLHAGLARRTCKRMFTTIRLDRIKPRCIVSPRSSLDD
jgi:hypothetical protein